GVRAHQQGRRAARLPPAGRGHARRRSDRPGPLAGGHRRAAGRGGRPLLGPLTAPAGADRLLCNLSSHVRWPGRALARRARARFRPVAAWSTPCRTNRGRTMPSTQEQMMNRPAPTDTADVTIATEVDEQALPAFASQGGDLDATQWVDPVEQAILLDRTRPAERHATQPPIASCARPSAAAAPAPAAARRLGSSPPEGAGQAAAAAASGAEVRPAGDRDQLLEDERPTAEEPPLAAVAGEDMLGNYRVLAPLASGGMGLLYLGEHRFLGYRVAIK